MKILYQIGTKKFLSLVIGLIVFTTFFLISRGIEPCSIQNHYDFPLTKTSVETALEKVNLDWDIIDENSIDESNNNLWLSSCENEQTLIIASMKKQGMLSFAIIPNNSKRYENHVFDDEKRKQLLHLACELTEIEKHDSIYRKFNKYITDRDSQRYGDATWYYKTRDKVLTIQLNRSSVYIGKYQINSIQVRNKAFFKEIMKIETKSATQQYLENGVPVYQDAQLKDIQRELSESNQSISRIVIEGNVTNTRKAKTAELEELTLGDSKYSLYPEDYYFANISDGTDTIKVLLPKYIVDLSLHNDGTKEWHITYYSSSSTHVVEYAVDTH